MEKDRWYECTTLKVMTVNVYPNQYAFFKFSFICNIISLSCVISERESDSEGKRYMIFNQELEIIT